MKSIYSLTRKFNRCAIVFSLLQVSVLILKAQVVSGADADYGTDYGFASQYNSGITVENTDNIQAQACFPTSVLNGLTYLYNYNGDTLDDYSIFNHNPGTYGDLNNLATAMKTANNPSPNYGTTYGNGANGTTSYLTTNNAAPTIALSGQFGFDSLAGATGAGFTAAAPTATFIASALNSNSAVQLWLWWGTYNTTTNTFTPPEDGGSHIVDIASLSLTDGSGTAELVVPESAAGTLNDSHANAQVLPATVKTVTYDARQFLYITYSDADPISGTPGETSEPGGFSTTPDDQAAGANTYTALVAADLVESVPEPAAWLLLGFGCVGLLGLRRWTALRA